MSIEQRTDVLVRDVRAKTGHREYSYQSGIPQREFVEYLNDAQDRLYNLITLERSTAFRKTGTISLTAGTSVYALPTDCYLQHNIFKAEYSATGAEQDYVVLDARISKEQVSIQGYPDSYFLRDGNIVVSPIPDRTGALLRLEYQYALPTLDVPRAWPSIASGGGSIYNLTLSFASPPSATGISTETEADLTDGMVGSVSLVERTTGAVLVSGVVAGSYNATTNVLPVTSSTNLVPYSLACFVVFGTYASTHSSLPQIAKRYLVEYATMRTQIRDANALEAALTSPLMQAMERDVLDAYANLEEDSFQVPILDYSMLGDDY